MRVLERLGERNAAEFTTGLPHDRYLYMCGVLSALRRVHALAGELLEASLQVEKMTDDRAKHRTDHHERLLSTYVSTPWWDERPR